jgi:hypothetical protein
MTSMMKYGKKLKVNLVLIKFSTHLLDDDFLFSMAMGYDQSMRALATHGVSMALNGRDYTRK